MIRRINFYGGPGTGKSTMAAKTFSWLREQGRSAELVREWIKRWVYRGRRMESFDAVYVFAQQLHAEDRLLQAGVEIVVTDSPLLLQCVYTIDSGMKGATATWLAALEYERCYSAVHFLLERDPAMPYEQLGRYQNRKAAVAMDEIIARYFRLWQIPYTTIPSGTFDRVTEALHPYLE